MLFRLEKDIVCDKKTTLLMNICYYTPHILEHDIMDEILKT